MSAPTFSPEAEASVAARVQAAGSSFFWSMRLLPRRRRDAIYAVYAFCRAVDDIADGPESPDAKLRELARWRQAIRRLFAEDRASGPLTQALRVPIQRFALPQREFLAVLDGMERDAVDPLVAPTLEELRRYCRQVAGAVGVLALQIFAEGDRSLDEESKVELAETLGEALQYTNVLRDLRDDAARGRLYLPRELLEAAAIRSRDPEEVLADPGIARAGTGLGHMARQRFAEARRLLERSEPRSARPCRLMLEVYARLLERILTAGFPGPDCGVRLPRHEKLYVVARYALF